MARTLHFFALYLACGWACLFFGCATAPEQSDSMGHACSMHSVASAIEYPHAEIRLGVLLDRDEAGRMLLEFAENIYFSSTFGRVERNLARFLLVRASIAMGLIEEAESFLRRDSDSITRHTSTSQNRALAMLMEAHAHRGELEAALKLSDELTNDFERLMALLPVARYSIDHGDSKLGMELLDVIERAYSDLSPSLQFFNFMIDISDLAFLLGDDERARLFLLKANDALHLDRDPQRRQKAGPIAAAQRFGAYALLRHTHLDDPQCCFLEREIRSLLNDSTLSPQSRLAASSQIVRVMVEICPESSGVIGDFLDSASRLASSGESLTWYPSIDIITCLLEFGRVSEAQDLAQSIMSKPVETNPNAIVMADGLTAISMAFYERGDTLEAAYYIAESGKMLAHADSEIMRANVIQRIAATLVRQDRTGDALLVALSPREDLSKIAGLVGIVEAMSTAR